MTSIFILIALFGHGSLSAHARSDAERALGSHGIIVPLSPEVQSAIDAYFTSLYRKIDLPGEENLPVARVVIVQPKNANTLAFVIPSEPGYIFWSADFFINSRSVDADLRTLAHERRHHMKENKALKASRDKEYDADIHAIAARLFRIGLRDPHTGQPQDALVNVDALLAEIQSREYTDLYINHRSQAAAVKVLYAKEYMRRQFPEAATKRDFLASLISAVRAGLRPGVDQSSRATVENAEAGTILSRLNGDLVGALKEINRRHETDHLSPEDRRRLTVELVSTYDRLVKQMKLARGGEAATLFEAVATLPMDFFRKWPLDIRNFENDPVLKKTPVYDLLHTLPTIGFQIGRASISGATGGFLVDASEMLSDSFDYLGTARLMRSLIDGNIDVEVVDHPMVAFLLLTYEQIAIRNLSRKEATLPPTLNIFHKRMEPRLRRAATASLVAPLLGEFLRSIRDDQKQISHFAGLMMSTNIEGLCPGLSALMLNQIPAEPRFTILRLAFRTGRSELKSQLVSLLDEGADSEFLEALSALRLDPQSPMTPDEVGKLWSQFLAHPAASGAHGYVPQLDKSIKLLNPPSWDLWAQKPEEVGKVRKAGQSTRHANLRRAMTARAQLDPVSFIADWTREQPTNDSRIATVTDWKAVFASVQPDNLHLIFQYGHRIFTSSDPGFTIIQEALVERMLELWPGGVGAGTSAADFVAEVLNNMANTTPATQRLLDLMISSLEADQSRSGASEMLHFLHDVRIANFTDVDRFITLYTDAFKRKHPPGNLSSPTSINNLHLGLDDIKMRLDPIIAGKILDQLAADYAAKPEEKLQFMVSVDHHAASVSTAVRDFHVWNEVFRKMTETQVLHVVSFLRGETALSENMRAELAQRLALSGIFIRTEAVENYLRHRFALLAPFERAGVYQLILDGATGLLDSSKFRLEIFLAILAKLPDPAVRKTFLDLWEAGMAALPRTLRSLVLSIVLSESGGIGSPEKALVTLLSHMGPLEQKFGQTLAFSNLPASYRDELRKLWDGAQKLTWWAAWELINVQIGDIAQAGYYLTRILNSGSTMAYLEITHRSTGRKFVVSVFRDGIETSVRVGAKQLRIFARELVAKDPARYSFMPLLVEDSIRTMSFELNAAYKRRMTVAMATAYRDAARRLGYTVDANGLIHADGFVLNGVRSVEIQLFGGKFFVAQELADGVPLRFMKEKNPEGHRRLTRVLLALEQEVLRDPNAPVDKDRMPGQNIFSQQSNTNYLLDHGQALHLDRGVHDRFIEFTRRGFTLDTSGLDQLLREITGYAPSLSGLRERMQRSEIGLRPLVYLAEASPFFLALDNKDPRKDLFFQLVHGVRAQLRLLQWEMDEELHDLRDRLIADAKSSMGFGTYLSTLNDLVNANVQKLLGSAGHWTRTFGQSESKRQQADRPQEAKRMEDAFSACERSLTH